MKKIKAATFTHFINGFPELDLPIVLSEENLRSFSANNTPLSQILIETYIIPYEEEAGDEFTEYIPCFRIKNTINFHTIIYYKAELLKNTYIMVSFNKDGTLISSMVIGGMMVNEEHLIRSISTIEEDWKIYIVENTSLKEEEKFDPSASKAITLELLATGEIISLESKIE